MKLVWPEKIRISKECIFKNLEYEPLYSYHTWSVMGNAISLKTMWTNKQKYIKKQTFRLLWRKAPTCLPVWDRTRPHQPVMVPVEVSSAEGQCPIPLCLQGRILSTRQVARRVFPSPWVPSEDKEPPPTSLIRSHRGLQESKRMSP